VAAQVYGCIWMSQSPTLYDLFDPTSLVRLERSIAEGRIPNREELAAVLEANSDRPLPPWFVATLIKSLRGELKSRPGRPKDHPLLRMRLDLAKLKYERYLAWLQKRQSSCGLQSWSAMRGKDWWKGPPHQRAARIVTARWLKHMSWRAFLNRVSS
jgi:hypothetical protein